MMCLACYCLTMEAGQEIDFFFFFLLLLPINTVMHRLAMVCFFFKKLQISDPNVWSQESFFVWSSTDAPLYIHPYQALIELIKW